MFKLNIFAKYCLHSQHCSPAKKSRLTLFSVINIVYLLEIAL